MVLANRNLFYVGMAAFVMTNFHLLRNVSPVFPLITIGLLSIATVMVFWRGLPIRHKAVTPVVLLIACMVFAILNSFVSLPEESYLDKIPRFLLTMPFLFIGASLSRDQLRSFLIVSACFGALGGLSLVAQIGIGPVSWFAEASERGGLVRYASILGSLTILGTFAGIALSAVYFCTAPTYLRAAVIFFIAIGCILSLQKAAIMNLLVFFLIVAAIEVKNQRYKVIGLSVLIFVLIIVFLSFYFGDYFQIALNNFFRMDSSVAVDDYDPVEGFIQRIWELPSRLYFSYGLHGLLLGVGLVGGSGALGFPDFPMAHNFVFDMLFIGGVQYLLAYTFIIAATASRLYRSRGGSHDVETASLCCLFFYILNLPATTGIQFHPVISSVINLIIGFYFISPLRLKVRSHVQQ